MQYKIYTLPIIASETEQEEMNHFIRSHKVADVCKQLVVADGQAYWSFCITYLLTSQLSTDFSDQSRKQKVDYRLVLDEESFARFTIMRKVRKAMAEEQAIPPYAIFTDAEMAEVAKLSSLTPQTLKEYADHLMPLAAFACHASSRKFRESCEKIYQGESRAPTA